MISALIIFASCGRRLMTARRDGSGVCPPGSSLPQGVTGAMRRWQQMIGKHLSALALNTRCVAPWTLSPGHLLRLFGSF